MTTRSDLKLTIGTIKVRDNSDYGRFSDPRNRASITHTDSYECAAWYTNSTATVGQVKPLILSEPYIGRGVYVKAHTLTTFDSVITSNNHAPLFGGVAFGKGEDRAGRAHTFGFTVPLITAVKLALYPVRENHARFDSVPYAVTIDADKLDIVRDIALQEAWNELQWEKEKLDESFASNDFHMVAHYAKSIAELGEEIALVAYGTTLAHEIAKMPPYPFIRAKVGELPRWFERLTPEPVAPQRFC